MKKLFLLAIILLPWIASSQTYLNVTVPASGTPTISSGFGTSPSIVNNNGPSSFSINVGTGAVATSGVIGLPQTLHGWAGGCSDVTTPASDLTQQTGSTSTTATVTNYVRTTGLAGAWPASDILECSFWPN
jgi:hypothetical protein